MDFQGKKLRMQKIKADVVILAGGFGTRLKDHFPNIPKPLVPIGGKPILEHLIEECKKYGFTNILLVLHHEADKIKSYFKDGKKFGVDIQYFIEDQPLGTAGALLAVRNLVKQTFFVLYADVFMKFNLNEFMEKHKRFNPDISIVVHPNDHPHDSDLVVCNEKNFVQKFKPHPHSTDDLNRNLVNAAVYIFNLDVLKEKYQTKRKFDIAQDLLPEIIEHGQKIYAYETVEYIKDMGTKERHKKVNLAISSGLPKSRMFETKKRAIFLDRDGTINVDVDHLNNHKHIKLIKGAAEAICMINKSKFLSVCITNQPVIARGECSLDDLNDIHAYLEKLIGGKGAYLDKIYFCPHHPDKGYEGEVAKYKINCTCRKPNIGMAEMAQRDMDIDFARSWVIGDRTADIELANRIGAKSILVKTGAAGDDKKYDAIATYEAKNLLEAVNKIKVIENDNF